MRSKNSEWPLPRTPLLCQKHLPKRLVLRLFSIWFSLSSLTLRLTSSSARYWLFDPRVKSVCDAAEMPSRAVLWQMRGKMYQRISLSVEDSKDLKSVNGEFDGLGSPSYHSFNQTLARSGWAIFNPLSYLGIDSRTAETLSILLAWESLAWESLAWESPYAPFSLLNGIMNHEKTTLDTDCSNRRTRLGLWIESANGNH